MPHIDRFTVSLDTELLAAFDHHVAAKGYDNRSEAIRDLIRDLLLTSRLPGGSETAAAILTVVCDHRVGEAMNRLRASLAENQAVVSGSLHLPIDRHRDALAVALRGPAGQIHSLANKVQAMRGITQGHLSIAAAAE